jgi:hypothetical protein
MKLRIKGASLRLRLTQGEIKQLQERGVVEEQVPFGAGVALLYRLRREPAVSEIEARFDARQLEILVPERLARQWCDTELVTLSRAQPVGADSLRITLEKDFACLAPRSDEDESDNFPHPGAAAGETC